MSIIANNLNLSKTVFNSGIDSIRNSITKMALGSIFQESAKPLENWPKIQFSNAWDGVYMPFFEQLMENGFKRGPDWKESMSNILEGHDVWFDDGTFRVEKKRGRKVDVTETFFALASIGLSCKEYAQIGTIHTLLQAFRPLVDSRDFFAVNWSMHKCLFHHYNSTLSFNDIPFKDLENISATKIQRAFRRHQFHPNAIEDPIKFSVPTPPQGQLTKKRPINGFRRTPRNGEPQRKNWWD